MTSATPLTPAPQRLKAEADRAAAAPERTCSRMATTLDISSGTRPATASATAGPPG